MFTPSRQSGSQTAAAPDDDLFVQLPRAAAAMLLNEDSLMLAIAASTCRRDSRERDGERECVREREDGETSESARGEKR